MLKTHCKNSQFNVVLLKEGIDMCNNTNVFFPHEVVDGVSLTSTHTHTKLKVDAA
jgi:hypothetical protein